MLAAFLLIAMLLVAGLAVDMMRHQSERTRVQGVADRAVLAAAVAEKTPNAPPAEDIIRSYFAAEGLGHMITKPGSISVRKTGGLSEVTIIPQGIMPTLLMRLAGIDTLPINVVSRASEEAGGVRMEIVMVLDLSVSMQDGTTFISTDSRIHALKVAARDFLTAVLTDNDDGEVAITFVPYATEVVMPPGTLGFFNNLQGPPSGNMGDAYCIDFREWGTVTDSINAAMIRRNCFMGNRHTPVRAYQHQLDSALAFVDTLFPIATTSIDLGVRVGGMFFDPTLRPIITHLIDNNQVSPIFADRPLDWNAPNTYRAMLLMTDGQNCCSEAWPADAIRNTDMSVLDANTLATCTALKAQGITIYTVAFEAPEVGVTLMENCASSPNHFFNSNRSELASTFQAIARDIKIQPLRLTQ